VNNSFAAQPVDDLTVSLNWSEAPLSNNKFYLESRQDITNINNLYYFFIMFDLWVSLE